MVACPRGSLLFLLSILDIVDQRGKESGLGGVRVRSLFPVVLFLRVFGQSRETRAKLHPASPPPQYPGLPSQGPRCGAHPRVLLTKCC